MKGDNPIVNELQSSGTVGPLGWKLVVDTVSATARARNRPPPDGHTKWTEDAAAEVATDWLFNETQGLARIARLVVAVDNDAALERYVERAIINELNSEARRTDRGAHIRAVRRHVESATDLEVLKKPVRYTLAGAPEGFPFSGHPELLHSSVSGLDIDESPLWERTTRRSPIGRASDVQLVVRTMLEAASAPVMESPTALDVVLHRFGVVETKARNGEVSLEEAVRPSNAGDPAADHSKAMYRIDEAADEHAVSYDLDSINRAADDLWHSMDPWTHLILAAYINRSETVRETERWSGLSKSAISRRQKKVNHLIAESLENVPFAEQVLGKLSERSSALRTGTDTPGSASNTDVSTKP